jgi:hypothetical protein
VTSSSAEGLTELALGRLKRAMGDAPGSQCAEDVMKQLGLTELSTPAELLDFANCLAKKGGVMEVVGGALKVAAILRGARSR